MVPKVKAIRRGKAALPSPTASGVFLQLADGDTAIVAPMVGMDQLVSIDQHAFWLDGGNSPIFPCLQTEECPGCQLEDTPRYRAFLPVWTKSDGAKIFSFGVSVARNLTDLEEEVGSIKGIVIKIKRQGSGLKTRWTILSLGKKVKISDDDIPDVEKSLGPTTVEEIRAMLAAAGMKESSGSVAKAIVKDDDELAIEDEKPAVGKKGAKVEEDDWDTIA